MLIIEAPVTCRMCKHQFISTYYVAIDAQQSEEACEQLLAGELNLVICPLCENNSASIDDLLLYHDGNSEVLIVSLPEASMEAIQLETVMESLLEDVPFQPYLDQPLIVVGQEALRSLVPWVAEFAGLEAHLSSDMADALLGHSKEPNLSLANAVMTWGAGRQRAGEASLARRWLEVGQKLALAWNRLDIKAEVGFRAALLYDNMEEYDRAIEHYREASEGFGQLAQQALFANPQKALELRRREGECLSNLGLCYLATGATEEAIRSYQDLLPMARDLNYEAMEAAALANLANAYRFQGNYRFAATYGEQALALYRRLGLHRDVANCLATLGPVYRELGDLAGALACYQEALPLHRAFHDKISEAATLGRLGIIAQLQGQLNQAESYYREELTICQELGRQEGQAVALNNLAGLAFVQGDLAAAEKWAQQALSIAGAVGLPAHQVNAGHRLGVVQYTRGLLDMAKATFERALALCQQHGLFSLEVYLLSEIADLVYTRGHLQDAHSRFQQAYEKMATIGDIAGQISQLRKMAFVSIDLTRWADAEQALLVALQLAQTHQLPRQEAHIWHTWGVYARAQGDLTEAEERLERALAIVEKLSYRSDQIAMLGGLADVYHETGRYSLAISYLEQAVKLAQEIGDVPEEALQWNGLGAVYRELGERDEAASCYLQALELFEQLGDRQGIASQLASLGLLHAEAGHLSDAKELLEAAATLSHQLEQPHNEARLISYLGAIAQTEGHDDVAWQQYEKASALAEQANDPWSKAQTANNRGALLRKWGRYEEALASQNAALDYLGEINAPQIRWRIYTNRGTTWRSLGKWEAAANDFAKAIDIIESVRRDVREETYRIGFFGDDPLFAYGEMVNHFVDWGRPAEALATMERARSRAFLDLLAETRESEPLGWIEIKALLS